MSESCFSSIVHKDFHNAMMAKKDAEIEALRAEVATPVLVATNRLADALANARAEITKLRDGVASDQERLKIYGDEISKLRAENARLKNLDMENIVNASKLEAEIAKLRAEREELRELLWWVEAKLQPELNVSNYHHQQVCELNANATEAVLAIRAALAEKGE